MELTRKYRPRRLKDIVGQSAAINHVEGMFARKQFPHCILITGMSGVGKTTLGRILAYMFNRVKYGRPLPDLMEETIGSERGIDNMRDIIASANFAPQRRYRVILLDEVHLLTKQAASALLGPIEDSPTKTIWILITNQSDSLSLLSTVIRRAYKIHLVQPKESDVRQLITRVARKEKIEFPRHNRVIRRIANMSAGSPADALFMLQSAMDAQAGSNYKDIIHKAASVLDSRAVDRLSAKLLIAIYTGKLEYALRLVTQITEYIPTINMILNFNSWMINQHTGHRGWWHPLTKQFQSYITTQPTLAVNLHIHAGLVNLRSEILRFSSVETHLLLARISHMIIHRNDRW
jgi:DNA polymerase-3 subunit gamma/tau